MSSRQGEKIMDSTIKPIRPIEVECASDAEIQKITNEIMSKSPGVSSEFKNKFSAYIKKQ